MTDVKYIDGSDLDKLNRSKLVIGDMLFTYVGTVGQVALIDENDRYYLAPNVALIRLNDKTAVLPSYLKYFFMTNTFYAKQIQRLLQSSSMKNIPMEKIRKFVIPVPPIETQKKIVSILDRFDKLANDMSEGLPAEIDARQKQYEYYRDVLLSFDEERRSQLVKVERERESELCRSKALKWFKLQDVLTIKNGKDYKTFAEGTIPVYGSGGIMAFIDTAAYDKPSVLIPRKGSIDKLYYVDKPFWTVDTIFYTVIDTEKVIPKYVYYWLQKEHLEKLNTAGGVPSLTQAVLNKVDIVVPSLEEQERIVSILDRFDKLCNDISEGIPAEIEARQKQYEYYRDKLLAFKEK